MAILITQDFLVSTMLFQSNKSIFVIAEMANSHEGDFNTAKKIVKNAAQTGAHAIKFQKFTADELAEPQHENYKLYRKLEMTNKNWINLIKFAKKNGLEVFVDIFGIKSAKFISKFVDGFKIHSSDINNPELLRFFSKSKKPILLSTAGCTPNEIDEALKILLKTPKQIVLMHGYQGYPTKLADLNLSRIFEFQKKYDTQIGLMDHISGNSELSKIIPLLGIALGAKVIEKHITLDRSKKGLDYFSALNPTEFKELMSLIHSTQLSLGKKGFDFSPLELQYRLNHKKNPIAKKTIKKNTKLVESLFEFKRTKTKHAISFYEFKNRLSSKKIPKGKPLTKDMIQNKPQKIVAALACRVDSTRLFAKPLQNVGKQTILGLLLNQIKKSRLINEIVLAISENPGNESFIQFAKKNKIKYVIGNDHDVLQRLISAAKYVHADIVFRITTENPFIYWEGIDKLIKHHTSGNYDFSYYEKMPLGAYYEVIDLHALELSHKKGTRKHKSELCTLYINEHKKKFKINTMKLEKILQRPEIRLTVDSPEDLWVARIIHNNLSKNGRLITLKKIIQFLDKNPHIKKINSNIPIGVSRIWN